MKPLHRLALYIGRRSWLPKIGPRLVFVDTALQRWTGGRLALSRLGGMTSVLLTTTGRRTGLPRDTPLIAIPEGGSLLLVGSNFGKPGHPAWSTNLIAHPEATIRTRGHTFPVTATLLTGPERAEAWHTLLKVWPAYDDYTTRSGRELRVFRVTLR
ncbi:MAG TPA: nitroreductase family deazaflavin-dependent oxidoreductase [Actinophytocola sp.]|uniref:nitroreductase family deazaflavin-dependent oxidoreductase n=1 Tax=Actinophytocola sp. TaxID=1872138 RepID=UPI002DDD0F8F|nr:nitroreductase family deazaflavin-dependent oxidoreductase [Actinophytocola sp.]HEV2780125.1 nitroreductase family deazaflavin-dependent oxidoreductase [Actinophytocola sp.]